MEIKNLIKLLIKFHNLNFNYLYIASAGIKVKNLPWNRNIIIIIIRAIIMLCRYTNNYDLRMYSIMTNTISKNLEVFTLFVSWPNITKVNLKLHFIIIKYNSTQRKNWEFWQFEFINFFPNAEIAAYDKIDKKFKFLPYEVHNTSLKNYDKKNNLCLCLRKRTFSY